MQAQEPWNIIDPYLFKGQRLQSRIHQSAGYFPSAGDLYIKREDELSSGIVGSKYRKYQSLIPHILKHGYDHVVLIGSAQSNNVVAGIQLCKENNLLYTAVLLESNEINARGNLLWIKMMQGESNHSIYWVKRQDWNNAETIAQRVADEFDSKTGSKTIVIPEGGLMPEALPGAITLGLDIVRNEQESGFQFDRIFVDSGTGMSAIGMLIGMALCERFPEVYITLIAGTEDQFRKKYTGFIQSARANFDYDIQENPNLSFHRPAMAASFGSITASVLKETIVIARDAGLLVDPVYTTKHFFTVKKLLEIEKPGRQLIIYNGGSLGLAGYQEMLSEYIR